MHIDFEQFTFRQLGWTISLQMEHSMSIRLNFSSSSSTVSSFPASPQMRHTAVCGRTGCRKTHTGLKIKPLYRIKILYWNNSSRANSQFCHSPCFQSFITKLHSSELATCNVLCACYLWIKHYIDTAVVVT